MDEGILGLVILIVSACVYRVIFHQFIRSYWYANIITALASASTIQLISYLANGYLNAFFLIAYLVSFGIAMIVASLVGDLIS